MATVNIKYAASAVMTCTIASLANGTGVGRSSVAVSNTTNLYDDVLLYIAVTASGTAAANDRGCYVHLYGSASGTQFSSSFRENVGGDTAVNLEADTNLKGPFFISCPGTWGPYGQVVPVAQFFNGVMPSQWGFVLSNFTGNTLNVNEANHIKTYTGITYTVV